MSRDPILVRILVAAYPPAWRRRYGDEFGQLLTETLCRARWFRRPAVIANILRGVVDARLQSSGGVRMSGRVPLSNAVWATALFTVAGIGFQKLSEGQFPAGPPGLVGGAFDALVVSAAVALVAIVVAALPTAIALAKGHTRGVWPLLALPPLAFGVWYGLLRVALLLARDHPVHSARGIVAAVLVIVGGVGVVAVTAWAATAVLRRVDTGPTRWPTIATVALTIGMGTGTVACLIWGLALRAADGAAFNSRVGLLATPLTPSWIGTVVLMGAATVLAGSAIRPTRADMARPA